MPISRNTDQSGTLHDHFTHLQEVNDERIHRAGENMIALIDMINASFKSTQIWGLTSLYRLVLRNQNDWKSPWYIMISASDSEFMIDYLMRPEQSPWEGARVNGGVKTLVEAWDHTLIAMKECGGWDGNEELQQLLRSRNLDK